MNVRNVARRGRGTQKISEKIEETREVSEDMLGRKMSEGDDEDCRVI